MSSMDNMWGFMDVIFAGAGLYVLYAAFLMKTTGEIKTSFLMNKDVELKKCKDLEGYKTFIFPKMVIFGVSTLLYGGAGMINSYVFSFPLPVYVVFMAIFMIVLIWFAVQARKGLQKFW